MKRLKVVSVSDNEDNMRLFLKQPNLQHVVVGTDSEELDVHDRRGKD